ncbi:hypothetical protein DIJ64_00445 [Mycobacterium leprae]|uniref:Uncharacterized protein n=1 Tax=Mycobacterium leprae TaxID=1769 RepID=A0AAD0KPN5_MYCLR|nr:hypothetical protein [Mycobacterium leprae]AWV47087.1 hypothetical protein DIJ64_00445 [Mycobacterium leprae]OAR21311.1 hypothetical protein A8144_06810 [Mycobacterium leprae 3125609]OAX71396.1 hypothetical protein A3216_05985 [Mycobacterium leprae 7935681]
MYTNPCSTTSQIVVNNLRNELQNLGFHRFSEATNSVKHRLTETKGKLNVTSIACGPQRQPDQLLDGSSF